MTLSPRLLRRAAFWACGLAAIVFATDFPSAQGGRNPRRMATEIVDGHEVAAREVLVRFRDERRANLDQAIAALETDADEVETVGRRGLRRMHSRRHGTRAMMALLRANPEVELVEPNFVIRLDATPNDPSFNNLWGLFNFGQNVGGAGLAGDDISATLAWDITTGSRANVIGVVDTGIDYNHPDLAANIWSAPSAFSVTVGGMVISCAAGTHGFNAITNSCDPLDDHSHGTHVAGTIGAVGNNARGVAGVNWVASMMGLKFLDASGRGFTSDAIELIDFAIQTKAAFAGTSGANVRILSNSWGGGGYSQSLKDAIDRANTAEMLFVAAAGNDNLNNDTWPNYPSNYTSANVVAVAATTNRDLRASFSNWGATTVDLGAPGVSILSTTPNNSYAYYNGTSMATPHVSGAAALVLANCNISTALLKTQLLTTIDPVAAMSGITVTGGRLNADRAVRACRPATMTVNGGSSPINVAAGASLSVQVADGPGYPGDWVTLVPLGSPASFWSGVYQFLDGQASVPATGRRTATLTFAAPAGGQYEFRFLSNGGYHRLATSAAITVANPTPVLMAITPNRAPAGSDAFSLTAAGSAFVPASQVLVDGVARPTTFVSASTLRAALTTGDMASAGAHSITVANPTPGGGTSGSVTLTITPPPVITVNGSSSGSVTVATGSPLTIGVSGGPANASDWVTIVPTGAAATYWSGTYQFMNGQPAAPGTGLPSATLSFAAPATAGSYEVRYLSSGGWTRLATRGPITVVTPNPAPTIAALIPGSVAQGGADFTLAISGSGFVASSSALVNGSPRATTFVTANALNVAVTAADIASLGNRAIAIVNPAPGGGTSAAANLSVIAPPPAPTLSAISPASVGIAGPAFALTVSGTAFTPASRVMVNGAPRPTTFVSATSLSASVSAADRATAGTLNVTVVTPAPGGGTSGSLPLSIAAPALLVNGSASTVTTTPGAALVVSVLNGPANPADWVTLVPVGASPTLWSGVYQFLNGLPAAPASGASSATLTFAAPAGVGTYEFRFLANSGWTRLANSAPVVVATPNPVPAVSALTPAAVSVGTGAFTLQVTGSGFITTSVVRINGVARATTFVSSSQLTVSMLAGDVAAPGALAVDVTTPAPGGGASGVASLTVVAPPAAPVLTSLNPSTASVGSTPMTIALTGANFAPTSIVMVDGQPRATTFVSSTTLRATLLGSDRVAGSRTIGVATPAPGGGVSSNLALPVTGPTLLLNGSAVPVTVAPGAALAVSVAGGPANRGDWVTLVPAGSAPNFWSGVYQFMDGGAAPPLSGASSGTLGFSAPVVAGTYEFRFFADSGWSRLATSPSVVVAAPVSTTTVLVNGSATPIAVAAGSIMTIAVSGGPANPGDWVTLVPVGAPATFWSGVYQFMDGQPSMPLSGASSATLTFTAPVAPGAYEFRFFANAAWPLLATSTVVTVP